MEQMKVESQFKRKIDILFNILTTFVMSNTSLKFFFHGTGPKMMNNKM